MWSARVSSRNCVTAIRVPISYYRLRSGCQRGKPAQPYQTNALHGKQESGTADCIGAEGSGCRLTDREGAAHQMCSPFFVISNNIRRSHRGISDGDTEEIWFKCGVFNRPDVCIFIDPCLSSLEHSAGHVRIPEDEFVGLLCVSLRRRQIDGIMPSLCQQNITARSDV